RLRPDHHPEAARQGRDKVLRRLRDAGVIAAAAAEEAMEEPVPRQRLALPFSAPHLAVHLAATAAAPAVVTTTIDGELQPRPDALAGDGARRLADGADPAVIVVETRGRAVRAYLGGRDFFAEASGWAGQVDLARARRSLGSTLKPFIYALAFDDRIVHP